MNLVELSKQQSINGMEMFLRNFSHVPDDKLHWTPTPTAKSALRVAAHTALYAGRFAKMIRNRQLPNPENLEEWLAQQGSEEEAITTREQMITAFREGTDEVLAALDTLTSKEIDMVLDSGQGFTVSMRQLMALPGWHATLHVGQIDYLQTCWGDREIYLKAK
jgi:uncharacterized damage-inducible protein DinB